MMILDHKIYAWEGKCQCACVCVGGMGTWDGILALLQLEEPLGTLARQLRGTPGRLGCSGQSLAEV